MNDRSKAAVEILEVLEKYNATIDDVEWLFRDIRTCISASTTVTLADCSKVIDRYLDDNL